ncbi:hypothetical protein BD413DRAFT_564983 [Trametes elegans]|nr:hypothetical protein BD413DRAFT_564983 [Trametes elegans]
MTAMSITHQRSTSRRSNFDGVTLMSSSAYERQTVAQSDHARQAPTSCCIPTSCTARVPEVRLSARSHQASHRLPPPAGTMPLHSTPLPSDHARRWRIIVLKRCRVGKMLVCAGCETGRHAHQ